jgi:hypothetical protein
MLDGKSRGARVVVTWVSRACQFQNIEDGGREGDGWRSTSDQST